MDGYEEPDRVTVAEAAETLGVKEQAIRKRIARGTLPHDKEPDSRVCVYVGTNLEDEVQSTSTRDDTHFEALVDDLQDQVRFLREELARKDALMLNMSETMRQLTALKDEGSPEARDSPETATGPIGRGKRLHRRGEATGTRTAARILGSPVRDARRVTGVVIILTWWGTVTASWNPIKGRVLAWVGEVDQTDLNGATPRNLVAVVGVLVARDAAVANAKNAGTSA